MSPTGNDKLMSMPEVASLSPDISRNGNREREVGVLLEVLKKKKCLSSSFYKKNGVPSAEIKGAARKIAEALVVHSEKDAILGNEKRLLQLAQEVLRSERNDGAPSEGEGILEVSQKENVQEQGGGGEGQVVAAVQIHSRVEMPLVNDEVAPGTQMEGTSSTSGENPSVDQTILSEAEPQRGVGQDQELDEPKKDLSEQTGEKEGGVDEKNQERRVSPEAQKVLAKISEWRTLEESMNLGDDRNRLLRMYNLLPLANEIKAIEERVENISSGEGKRLSKDDREWFQNIEKGLEELIHRGKEMKEGRDAFHELGQRFDGVKDGAIQLKLIHTTLTEWRRAIVKMAEKQFSLPKGLPKEARDVIELEEKDLLQKLLIQSENFQAEEMDLLIQMLQKAYPNNEISARPNAPRKKKSALPKTK